MPYHCESNLGPCLSQGALNEEEQRWLETEGACAVPGPYEAKDRYRPSFWMALGFLALIGFDSIKWLCSKIAFGLFAPLRGGPMLLMVSVAAYTLAVMLVWRLASGRMEEMAGRFARRYSDRLALVRDLLIAMAILVLGPHVWDVLSVWHMSHGRELSIDSMAFACVPWLVCAWIFGFLLPLIKGKTPISPPPSEFTLDSAIAAWRRRLLAGEGVEEDDALELEEHLREEAAALARTGVPEYQAFAVACRRMGGQESLSREFAKAQPEVVWRTRARWILMGVLTMFVFQVVLAAMQLLLLFGYRLPLALYQAAEIAVWASGVYLFARFANGGLARFVEWLNHRHTHVRALATDLAFLMAAFLTLQLTTVALFGDGHAGSPLQIATMLVLSGDPTLFAACAGVYWLRPAKMLHRS